MPRDFVNNKNITVPFEKGGFTLKALLADAEKKGMLNRLGLLIMMRLGDYYEALHEGRILPKGVTFTPGSGIAATTGMVGGSMEIFSPIPETPQNLGPNAADNAPRANGSSIIGVGSGSVDLQNFSYFDEEEDDEEEGDK